MNLLLLLLLPWVALLGAPIQSAAPATDPPAPVVSPPAAPRAPRPPSQPIKPPHLAGAGVVIRMDTDPNALPPLYHEGATQWVVEPGTSWKQFADRIKPGDEILFTAWFHIPQDFEGLEGTSQRPIIIRSRSGRPASIMCDEFGFRFNRCRHIVVENLYFLNANDAAILVDGSPVPGADPESPQGKELAVPWSADMLIRNCTLAGSKASDEQRAVQDGIRLRRVSNVRVDAVRVDGWNDAALEIDTCQRVLIRGLMMVTMPKCDHRRGIAVLGPSSEINLNVCTFNAGIIDGVVIGTAGMPDANGAVPVPPVERMRLDRCAFDRVGNPITIANVRDLVINRCTFLEPRLSIYRIAPDAGVVQDVIIDACLGTWPPGGLVRFSPHPDHISPSGLVLRDNLWYSAELPEAFEEIGQPFGFQGMSQTFTIDPSVNVNTLNPEHADATRYGVFSPVAGAPVRPVPSPESPDLPPLGERKKPVSGAGTVPSPAPPNPAEPGSSASEPTPAP